jgi:hypothetical protein
MNGNGDIIPVMNFDYCFVKHGSSPFDDDMEI